MKFFNIHTHAEIASPGSIINVLKDFDKIPREGFFSAGMHPWFLGPHAKDEFHKLEAVCLSENVVAIGECGLDKVCRVDMDLQKKWFVAQIRLADQLNKPLIIHCVRAYEEVFALLKEEKVAVPVIFHGFGKGEGLARRIADQGYYLSFGKSLRAVKVKEVFKNVPLDRVFLETDDASIRIAQVYEAAAAIRQITMDQLQQQLFDNAEEVFGGKFVTYDD